mgnify:FL=1
MRRGLFFVLMVVLVLRGLTGTAMAAGVLPPLALTQATHQHDDAAAQHAIHDDASRHSTASDLGSHCQEASAECHPHEHATCSACEICHSAMLAAPGVSTTAARLPSAHLRHTPAPLHNAPAALLIKPPIA